jgi:aminoglycoside phosphotransferase (APT) family kinase protein
MRTEPDLDRGMLLDLLRDRYPLEIERLDFVPIGLDSWSYATVLRDGSRVFLKLFRPTDTGAATRCGAELPLLAALAELGRVPVARPLADREGRLVNTLDGFELSVLEYLEGRTLEDETIWPDVLYAGVAQTVGAIHASTPAIRHLVPGTEWYALPFVSRLASVLATLEAGEASPARDDPTLAELRDLVVPHAVELRAGIERLEELANLAANRRSEDVLCHTDIWGSNLLLSDDGSLHVLDWNGALIGPVEHDLFMFAGTGFFPADRFGWFLDRYEAAFRPVRLDADVFGFYFYRRNLEDLAEFLESLMEGKTEAMDRSEAFGVAVDLLGELPELEVRISDVRQVLQERA